jgi:hypothetical protein
MILASPFHICLTFLFFHQGPACPSGPSSRRTA